MQYVERFNSVQNSVGIQVKIQFKNGIPASQ